MAAARGQPPEEKTLVEERSCVRSLDDTEVVPPTTTFSRSGHPHVLHACPTDYLLRSAAPVRALRAWRSLFWIADVCSLTLAVRALISVCCRVLVASCFATVAFSCLIVPSCS